VYSRRSWRLERDPEPALISSRCARGKPPTERMFAMKTIVFILGLIVLAVLFALGWQIGARELANIEFQDDLHDLSAQNGVRIGLASPESDDGLRDTIIQIAAQRYDIQLEPRQVTVQRSDDTVLPLFRFDVDYQARVGLPGFYFYLHFAPSSAK
jgi:hypothetical protein